MHLFFERTPERKKETLFNLVHKNKIFQCCEAVVGEVPSCSCEVLFNLKKWKFCHNFLTLMSQKKIFWGMLVTKNTIEVNVSQNCLVTNILQIIFSCVLQKDNSNTGLDQIGGE